MKSNAGTLSEPHQDMDTQMNCLKSERYRNGKCTRLNLVYVLCTNVMNVCGECRLYEARAVITSNRDRRPSHKIDCTGIIEYVL
ncbi:hypothetical protein HanIR_Chr17g0898791 [Helianthus annuus]|nr:hypothetical protein HanIR_Chr17g0898791 [Helianthus annuus]